MRYLRRLPQRNAMDFDEIFPEANPDALDFLEKLLVRTLFTAVCAVSYCNIDHSHALFWSMPHNYYRRSSIRLIASRPRSRWGIRICRVCAARKTSPRIRHSRTRTASSSAQILRCARFARNCSPRSPIMSRALEGRWRRMTAGQSRRRQMARSARAMRATNQTDHCHRSGWRTSCRLLSDEVSR